MKKIEQENENITDVSEKEESEKLIKDIESGLFEGKLPKEKYIQQIQHYLKKFKWNFFGEKNPNVQETGKIDFKTTQALNQLKTISNKLNINIQPALNYFNNENYYYAEYTIDHVIGQINNFAKPDSKKQIPSFQEEIQHISKWPAYFPTSWSQKNIGRQIGGIGHGKECTPWRRDEQGNLQLADYKDFRACQTPDYNQFLMWGPNTPSLGIIGTGHKDPRRAAVAAKYPNVFSPQAIKERVKRIMKEEQSEHSNANVHSHIVHIPSPGFSPYVEPPTSDIYYKDPNNPNPEQVGPKFFDKDDRDSYYKLLKLYNKYKDQEMQNPLTKQYKDFYLKFYPKKKVSKYLELNKIAKLFIKLIQKLN